MRGKWVTRGKIHKVIAGELKLPLSSLAFDVWGRDGEAWVFESGDGDGFCEADIDTLVPVPWLERSTAQLIVSMREIGGEPCSYDTRHILRKLMARFKALGLTPVVASEMEFYLLREEDDALGRPVHTQTDRVGGGLPGDHRGEHVAVRAQPQFLPALPAWHSCAAGSQLGLRESHCLGTNSR